MNLIYPLEKKGTKTSGFGNRIHPVKKKKIHHNGIDIGIPNGTSVRSVADGEVVRSDMRDKNGYGNFIIIKHNLDGKTKYSCYAHLTKRLVDVGDKVVQGEEIAKSGGGQGLSQGGGMTTGPHLHFEIRNKITGDWEDPEKYIGSAQISKGKTDKKQDTEDDNEIENLITKITKGTSSGIDKLKKLFKDIGLSEEEEKHFTKIVLSEQDETTKHNISRIKDIMKKVI